MKKNVRKTHVDGEEWKWYVTPRNLFQDEEGTVIIFSPEGKRYVFLTEKVGSVAYDEDGQESGYTVGPGDVARIIKEYIKLG